MGAPNRLRGFPLHCATSKDLERCLQITSTTLPRTTTTEATCALPPSPAKREGGNAIDNLRRCDLELTAIMSADKLKRFFTDRAADVQSATPAETCQAEILCNQKNDNMRTAERTTRRMVTHAESPNTFHDGQVRGAGG